MSEDQPKPDQQGQQASLPAPEKVEQGPPKPPERIIQERIEYREQPIVKLEREDQWPPPPEQPTENDKK